MKLDGVGLGLRIELADAMFADENCPVDFVELHPENFVSRGGPHAAMLARAMERFPIVTHGLTMGFGNVEAPSTSELQLLRSLLRRLDVPFHSDHLCYARRAGRFLHDLLPLPMEAQTVRVASQRVRELRDALEIPIAIENVSYYIPRTEHPLEEAELLAELLETADAKLLLDVNNVVVNAHNHGFDARDYLARIPMHRVVQLHVAGHLRRPDGLRIDTHSESVDDEVLSLLPEVLARTGPVPLLLERDGNYPAYAELREELLTLRRIYDEAMTQLAQGPPAVDAAAFPPQAARPERPALHARHTLHVQTARSLPSPVRAAEPAELAELERATTAFMFDLAPAGIGNEVTAPRYRLQREMVQSRLIELAEAAMPRTARRLGRDRFTASVRAFFATGGPTDPIFYRAALELVDCVARELQDPADRDLLAVDRYEWLVRQAPYAPDPTVDGLDFAHRPALRSARESFDVRHRVHLELAPGERPVEEASRIVVFLGPRQEAHVLSLNASAALLFDRLARGDESVADSLRALVHERRLAVTPRLLEALVETLGQWVELGLLLGTHSNETA